MYINNILPAAIASQVWGAASRTLTSINNVIAPGQSLQQTLAAGSTVNILATATKSLVVSLGAKAGAAGTCVITFQDGTTSFTFATIAAGQTGVLSAVVCTSSAGAQLQNNDAVNTVLYSYTYQMYQ